MYKIFGNNQFFRGKLITAKDCYDWEDFLTTKFVYVKINILYLKWEMKILAPPNIIYELKFRNVTK